MPDMDGFETAELIRQRPRLRAVPIIFMTAGSDEAHALRGYSLGAVDYVQTPVVPDVLRTKVRVFVDLFRKTEELRAQAEERIALVREQGKRAAAEEAGRRSAFLAEAGKSMARSLDLDTTAQTIVDLVVPELGEVAMLRVHRGREEAVYASRGAGGLAWSPPAGAADAVEAALRTLGRQTVVDRVDGAEAVRAIVCPLLARGRALGVLIVRADKACDPPSMAHLDEMAAQAAIALDNCLLYQEIEERDIRKEQFVAMLAHELRNPLGVISSAVEVLDMVAGDPADRAREIIKRQVQHLSQLVGDLVDTARITTGKISLSRVDVDLAESVARCLKMIEVAGRADAHEIHVDAQETRVHADPARVDQILGNILGNALKYTPAGGRIAIRVAPVGDRGMCEISDTGMGMSPDVLEHAFELFYQEQSSADRARGGLGIGLTLVRQLVELHGGSVEAWSAGEGHGSRFTVRLPLSTAVGAGEPSAAAAPALTRRPILPGEDHPGTGPPPQHPLTPT